MRASFLAFSSLLCVSMFAEEMEQETSRPMRIVTRHIEANGIGYREGYTTFEGFFSPIKPLADSWVPFLDLRAHIFNSRYPAINAGVGARYIASSRVWGANVYYDYRKTHRMHYNQIALGFESLGKVWDFRLNGYLPVGRKVSPFWGSDFSFFQGHYAFVSGKKEFALKGVNAEAAAHINVVKNIEAILAIGPYYLVGHGGAAWGGEARAELNLYKYCKLEGFTSYDSIFRWTGQGQLSLVIPFGGKRKIKRKDSQSCPDAIALSHRSVQEVKRFEIIPVDRKKSTLKAINPSTNKPYFFWFVDNTSHSLGTFESPFATLNDAENASSTGNVIYVFPGDGTSTGMNEGIVLQDKQYLFGAGVNQTLLIKTGEMLIPPQANGLPILTAPSGRSVVTVANGNSISGFQISTNAAGTLNGSYCIGSVSGEVKNLFISENILNASNGASAIIPNAPSGKITVTSNIIDSGDRQGNYGIFFSQVKGDGTYNISNNSISNFQNATTSPPQVPSGTAIAILAQNQSNIKAAVSRNQIIDCTGHGMDIRSSGTGTPTLFAMVSDNLLFTNNLSGTGINMFSDNSGVMTFQIVNNQIDGFTFGIIGQAETNSSMTGWIESNTLANSAFGSGMVLETNFITQSDSATGVFTVVSNEVFNYDVQGIATAAYGTSSLTATIVNNQVHNIGLSGLFLKGFVASNSKLVILNNLIQSNRTGILADSLDDATIDVLVQGNTIRDNNGSGFLAQPSSSSNAKYDIFSNIFTGNNQMDLDNGSAVTMGPENDANVCLSLTANQSTQEATQPDYDLSNMGSGQFNVEPLVGNTGTIEQSGTIAVPEGHCGF